MEAGDTVTVYEDPMTKTMPEGKATLVQRLDDPKFCPVGCLGAQRWRVQFSDGEQVDRWIEPTG